ncbi:MAG: hypothetical protein HQK50_17200 [Oligoflexia bacterium]|nr:hypothetical protein [Oligoflexia bacterium]MBF0367316.1 hypothetical protein [Oligoflexia bacterium]
MQSNARTLLLIFVLTLLFTTSTLVATAFAAPMDWQGTFGAETALIQHHKRTSDAYINDDGSEQIQPSPGDRSDASFQNYILKLSPTIVINDGATLYGELSTNYNSSGYLGESSTQKQVGAGASFGDALYLQHTSNGRPNLVLNQFYLKIFADTATYIIGRQSFDWGAGAIYSGGNKTWDRYKTIQDGLTVKFKVGNFHVTPYWAKISMGNTLSSSDDTKTYGLTVLYDSVERDMAFGLLYGKKTTGAYSTFFTSGQGHNLGRTDVKITDLYMKKGVGDYTLTIEAPLISGDLGNVYSPDQSTKYKAYAVVTESSYKFNDNWSAGALVGIASGEDGLGPQFKAMYLNPNYQIANLLFRYNLAAVADTTQNLYDSYITNARYLKLHGNYQTGPWSLNAAVITAKANEVAKGNGNWAFNHTRNKRFISNSKQNNNLGTELDFNAIYQWNNTVSVHADVGYLFVGDYFNYTNSADGSTVKLRNSYSTVIGVSATF